MSVTLADYAIPEEEWLPCTVDPAVEWCPPGPMPQAGRRQPDGIRTPDLDGLDSGTWTPTTDDETTYTSSNLTDDTSTFSGPFIQATAEMGGCGFYVPCIVTPIGPPTPYLPSFEQLPGDAIGCGSIPVQPTLPALLDQDGSPQNAESLQAEGGNQIVPFQADSGPGAGPQVHVVPGFPQQPADSQNMQATNQIVWCQYVMPDSGADTPLSMEGDEQAWSFLHEFQDQNSFESGDAAWFFGDGGAFQDPFGRISWPGAPFCVGSINHRLSHYHVPKVNDFKAQSVEDSDKPVTTLMIRNIPNRYTRKMLMCELDSLGFLGQYDFIYVPMDRNTHWNVGYAFVNFVKPENAKRCIEMLTDYRFRRFRRSSSKVTQVSAAHIQGLEKNMEHYSNTAVQSSRIQSHRPLLVRPKTHCAGGNDKWEGRCGWQRQMYCRDDMWTSYTRREPSPTEDTEQL